MAKVREIHARLAVVETGVIHIAVGVHGVVRIPTKERYMYC